jgi:hypothetical protein
MSKSQGNAILLSTEPEAIREAVHRIYTDPNHLRTSDPGTVEGKVVFTYLDAFDENEADVAELKTRHRRGGLGDMACTDPRAAGGLCSQTGIRDRCPGRGDKERTSHHRVNTRRVTVGTGAVHIQLKNWLESECLRRVETRPPSQVPTV